MKKVLSSYTSALAVLLVCMSVVSCIGWGEVLDTKPSRLKFGKEGGRDTVYVEGRAGLSNFEETESDFETRIQSASFEYETESTISPATHAWLEWAEVFRVDDGVYAVIVSPNDSGKERCARMDFRAGDDKGELKLTQKAE